MTTTHDEVVAATIQREITYLEGLLQELAAEPTKTRLIKDRIQQVEERIRKLRIALAG